MEKVGVLAKNLNIVIHLIFNQKDYIQNAAYEGGTNAGNKYLIIMTNFCGDLLVSPQCHGEVRHLGSQLYSQAITDRVIEVFLET